MPQLDPTWFASQLFWLAVTFVLLYTLLSRLVLPPLMQTIARRSNTLEGDLFQAESLKSQAEQARLDYERTLASARDKAQSLMKESMDAYKAKAERANKEMDLQIEQKLVDATRRILAQKEDMLKALTPTMGELTSLIFHKLTQETPTSDQVHRILSELEKNRR